MGKNRGKVRNRARDMLWDYYMTNEMSRCENSKRQKTGERGRDQRKLRTSERVYLAIIVTGLIGISIKYLVI